MFITNAMRQLIVNEALVNQLGLYGDFRTDSNSDGLADGLTSTQVTYSWSNKVQTITANTISNEHYTQFANTTVTSLNWATGDKLYYFGWAKSTIGRASFTIYNREIGGGYGTAVAVGSANSGSFELLSTILTVTSKYSTPNLLLRQIVTNAAGGTIFIGAGEKIEVTKLGVINLTQVFGSAVPTKAELDAFITANPGYFTQIDYMKV